MMPVLSPPGAEVHANQERGKGPCRGPPAVDPPPADPSPPPPAVQGPEGVKMEEMLPALEVVNRP